MSEVNRQGVDISGALVHGNVEPNRLTIIPTIDPVTGQYRAPLDSPADETTEES